MVDAANTIDTPLTRRAFLVGAAGLAVATACGRPRKPETTQRRLMFNHAHVELAKGDSRLAFALFDEDKPVPYQKGVTGRLAVQTPDGRKLDPVALRSFPIVRGVGGDEARQHHETGDLILVARLPFDQDGFWDVQADVTIGGRRHSVPGRFGVAATSQTIAVGQPGVPVATPTTTDHRGVEPICTRVPACTMHDLSLDQALTNGKPTVATFATPALCTSRMCGPDVDVVEAVHLRRAQDANFLHIEIYTDQTGQQLTPGVKAWKVDQAGEPWVFLIGRDGVVRERLSGPIGEWEVDEAVARLTEP